MSYSFAFAFPYPKAKVVLKHPEQIPSGGNWPLIHSLRLLGNRVTVINLYNEKDEIDAAQATIEYETLLKQQHVDALFVFDTGRAKIKWYEIAEQTCSGYSKPITIYEAGDDPMRHEANQDAITFGKFDGILAVQLPFVQKYKEQFNVPVVWKPYHHDGLLHYPEPMQKIADVIHIGKVYGLREPMLRAFAAAGINILAGEAWGHMYRKKLCQARVGWNQAWSGEVGYRHFELPAMGQVLICDKLAKEYGFEELYPEDCYICYDGKTDDEKISEAVETIKWALKSPEKVNYIAQKGMVHALERHGPLSRAQLILEFFESIAGERTANRS